MKFKIILSAEGKQLFKGGNIEPISKPLIEFKADSLRAAEREFTNIIYSTVGSGSMSLYNLEQVKP
jgi:hypothetical protein